MKKYLVIILLIIAISSLFARGNKEIGSDQIPNYNYEVRIDNMTCPLCDVAVEKQLRKLDWIQAVEGDHKTGLALLQIDNPLDKASMEKIIITELDKIDYTFVGLRKLING
ncbi:MAG: heavy-metal-associated domain-containing protein [Spirochaetales bacterium]|nr:heavy-metal-associated domain-containing protein [Spirochaetales bacterium]